MVFGQPSQADPGDVLWSFGASSGDEKISYRETAYVALGANGNNHVYVVGDDLRVHAIATTGGSAGSQVWVSDTTDWGSLNSQASTSPAVDASGVVWFGTWNGGSPNRSTLFALDPADGDVLWDFPVVIGSTPEFVGAPTIDGNQFVYAALGNWIVAVSPDGASYDDRWAYQTDDYASGYGYLITAAPILGLDSVASSTTNQLLVFPERQDHVNNGWYGGRIHALTVTSTSSTASYTDEWYWEFPDYADDEHALGGLAMGHDGTIYVGSNASYVYALDPEDAMNRVKWDTYLGSNTAVTGSPVVGADGTIYIGATNGKLYALDPADGDILWQHTVGTKIECAPVIGADGALYVFDNDGSYECLSADVNAGTRVLWTTTFGSGHVKGSHPAMDNNGVIYVCIGDYNVSTGQLKAIEGFGRPGMTPWPMHGRNARRSAKYRPPYSVTTLGTFNYLGNTITPQWVNNSGMLVGHGYDGTVTYDRSLTWYNGSFTALGTMSGFTQEHYAWSINDSGTTAGWAKYYTNYYAPHYTAGFRRTYGGSWDELAPLYEFDSNLHLGYAEPEAINNDGIVVGKSKNSSGVFRATRWNSGSSSAVNLESLEGDDPSYYSYTTYINQGGYIVGGSETSYTGNPIHAFFITPEQDEMTAANDLGTPSGDDEDESFANGINDHGIIIMYAPTNSYANYRAFFKLPSSTEEGIEHTKDEDFIEVGFPGNPYSVLLHAINNLNQAVGTVAEGWTYYMSVVPLHLNQSASLSELAGSGWTVYSANHLNDQGEIVGTANGGSVILRPQD